MLIFKQLKYGSVGRAAGYDVESCDFMTICQDAVRQLMIRGNWWGTVHPIEACVRNGEVVWPRGVDTILGMNICNQPMLMANRWYKFMQPDNRFSCHARDWRRNRWFGNSTIISKNTSPVFNPIKSEGFVIRTFITQTSDAGKFITYYGVDVNGNNIITERPDGTIQDGVQVELKSPFADTPMAIRHVTRVTKDDTDGDVIAYQYNVATGMMLDLARYQPSETNPEYIVTGVSGCGHDSGACNKQVSSLVSLSYYPFKFNDDVVQIDCEDAIRDMVMSIRKKDSGDISGALAFETSAIRELNYQMKHRYPDEQFIVNFRPFGNDNLNNPNINIGMI